MLGFPARAAGTPTSRGKAQSYGRPRKCVHVQSGNGTKDEEQQVELKPQSAYYLVCPEVISERPAVAAFRKWLLE